MENFSSELRVSSEMKSVLGETAKWTKFFAILGFISLAFLVCVGFFAGFIFSHFPQSSSLGSGISQGLGIFVGFIYIIIAGILFMPYLYLYRFSTKMQVAIKENDEKYLLEAFKNHKSYYKYIGIFTIIVLVFYGIIIFFTIIGSLLK